MFEQKSHPKNVVQKLTKRQIVTTLVLGLIASLLCGADSSRPFLYYIGVFVGSCVLLAGVFLPKRLLIYPVFILIINMVDLTQAGEDFVESSDIYTATPWQFRLGPVSPSALVFCFLLVIALRLFDYRIFKQKKDNLYGKGIFIYFFYVVTIVSFWFGYPQQDIGRFMIDVKLPLFFGIGLIIFGSYYYRYPEAVLVSCQVFLALLAGHFLLDLIYLFTGASTSMADYRSLSVDSGKGLAAFMIFWGLGNLLNRRQTIFSIALCITSFFLLISYQTRWLIITLALGLFVMVPLLLGTKRVLKIYVPVLLISIVAVPVLIQLRPDVWEYMMLRFSFIENLVPGARLEDVEAVRAASIYNSTGLLIEEKALLTGMGYGSWYDGRFYPMPRMTESAFDAQSLNAGRYYRVHDFTFHFLFKFGIIGLGLYLALFLKPLRLIWKMRRGVLKVQLNRSVSIMLFGSVLLVVSNMWFTGKGLLVSALFVSVSHAWVLVFKKSVAEPNVLTEPKLQIQRVVKEAFG